MDKFIVSARKYRPQTFDTVVGQEHITTTLKNAIKNNQLAHAFLFCGPRGVGKTTCARILAKTINCEARTADTEACNECISCRSFSDGNSLNIHELDAASNNSVDDIRTLTEQVRFAPQAGRYKVYIIDEVHMLSTAAFNAFLKTLEEPPPYAIFILATTEKHKILPTILSRCQIFDFKRITTQDTAGHLQKICTNESIRAEKAALQLIAQKSEGCMRDALSIMDKIISFTNGELSYAQTLEHLNILDEDYYFKLLEHIMAQDLSAALLLYNDINSKGFEGDLLLDGMAEFIRNLLVSKDGKALVLLDVVESFREKYAETALKTDLPFLISALNVLNEAEIQYKSARNKRLHVELTLIKLSYLRQALSLSSEEGVKKKLSEGTAVAFRKISITPVTTKKQSASEGPSLKIDSSLLNRQESQISQENPGLERKSSSEVVKQKARSGSAITGSSPSGHAEEKGADDGEIKTPRAPKKEPSAKIGRLNKIRNSIGIDSSEAEIPVQPLEIEKLQSLWKEFGTQLKQEKNPAYKSFELASLHIEDAGNFTVITNNNLEQKFIDQEKMRLSAFLQTAFCNRNLFFNITVTDTPETEIDPVLTLNKKQQFLKITGKYPLVKELKDRLKLELDY